MAVVIETTLGDITVDLYCDRRPVTCLNFLKLCKMKYYNFNLFHTIRSGFIAQTGDPTGEGSGGKSIWGMLEGPEKRFFSAEKMPKIRHTDAGLLSMVCTDDMMVGSQFFITLASNLDSLDGVHCVIGEVTEGHEVLRKLNEVICDESHRPYRDVRITHTVVLEDPFNDLPGLRAPSRSPSPNIERLKGGRIAPDEQLDETEGKSAAEIQEMIEEKEAKARATILEIVGDLPDADIAPPENVLFVCKLNPVTSDEDLEIIFSRFGKIVSCEVIRDRKTGESLQYAFIEFDDKKSCENAYFKMDNVLIDDRRIHVDFSQSVSKMQWLGKGRGVRHIKDNSGNDGHINKPRRSKSRERNLTEHHYKSNEKETHNIHHKNTSRDTEKNRSRDTDKNRSRDTDKNRSKDTDKNRSRDTDKNRSRDTDKNTSRDTDKNRSRDTDKNRSRDTDKNRSRDTEKNRPRDTEKHSEHRYESERKSKYERSQRDRVRSPVDNGRDDRQEKLDRNEQNAKSTDNRRNRNHKKEYDTAKEEKLKHEYRRTYSTNKHSPARKNRNESESAVRDYKNYNSRDGGKDAREHSNHKIKKSTKDNNSNTSKNSHNDLTPRTPSPVAKKKTGKNGSINEKKKRKLKIDKKKSNKVKQAKKKHVESTSSSSDSESSSETSSTESSSTSSSSSIDKKKKRSSRKRKYSSSSTSESSSSTSSSDSSTSSSSSSDSEVDRKKSKKKVKKVQIKNSKKRL